MTERLAEHPHFTPWTDPHTKVVSYVLSERVAPYQKALYYVTPSISADGRWLWFQACFPPGHRSHLAVVSLDPARPLIRYFPGALMGGGPLLTPQGDSAYVPVEDGIHLFSVDGTYRPVLKMPAELIQNRRLGSLVTELTISADGRYFLLDSQIGNRTLIALGEVQTGQVKPLHWFSYPHHHAAFSLTDPELFLLNQAPAHDPYTGDKINMNVRMWLMNTRLTRFEPLFGDLWFNHNSQCCHEWWASDGRLCWCDYDRGIFECDVRARVRRKTLVWKRGLIHGQCERTRRYFVGDENTYKRNTAAPCRVWLYDRRTGREAAIVSTMPEPALPSHEWRPHHIDPHPHFSPNGRYVVYTTTARGQIDVAVTPVAGVLDKLKG